MNAQVMVPMWVLIVTPVATVLGTMFAVMMAALFQNRAVESLRSEMKAETAMLRAEILAARSETKQLLAELELRLTKQISELSRRVEKLEEQRGLVRP